MERAAAGAGGGLRLTSKQRVELGARLLSERAHDRHAASKTAQVLGMSTRWMRELKRRAGRGARGGGPAGHGGERACAGARAGGRAKGAPGRDGRLAADPQGAAEGGARDLADARGAGARGPEARGDGEAAGRARGPAREL